MAGESSACTCWASVPGRLRALLLIVVQASSAAAKDAPAATVMATGKPAAILAGSSKAEPDSPAARGRAATAIIWPRRESALLTADAIPECCESTLARTVAVMGVISAARPTPNTSHGGRTPEKYRTSQARSDRQRDRRADSLGDHPRWSGEGQQQQGDRQGRGPGLKCGV